MRSFFVEGDYPKSVHLAEVCSDGVKIVTDRRDHPTLEAQRNDVTSLTVAFQDKYLTNYGRFVKGLFKGKTIVDLGSGNLIDSGVVPILAAVSQAVRYVGVDINHGETQKNVLFAEDENINDVIPGLSIAADLVWVDMLAFLKSDGLNQYDGCMVISMIGLETLVHQMEELGLQVGPDFKRETSLYIQELLELIRNRLGYDGRLLKGTGTVGINFESSGFVLEKTATGGQGIYKIR